MKDQPILFSGPMVRAILDNRKTQTRRPVKPQPARIVSDWSQDAEPGERVIYRGWPHRLEESRGRNKSAAGELYPRKLKCPYGVPSDLLWVKETLVRTVASQVPTEVRVFEFWTLFRVS